MFQKDPATELSKSLKSIAQVVRAGFEQSSIVMVNEAHEGMLRCVRTREVGVNVILAAHQSECRSLAVEALQPGDAAFLNKSRGVPADYGGSRSYLSQPDMQRLLQTALDLKWTLIEYEADADKVMPMTEKYGQIAGMNERDRMQAENLAEVLKVHQPLLVWCGDSHNSKVEIKGWIPMAVQFQKATGINPFCIDQTKTIKFPCHNAPYDSRLVALYATELKAREGLAAFLAKDRPWELGLARDADAYIFSLDNEFQ